MPPQLHQKTHTHNSFTSTKYAVCMGRTPAGNFVNAMRLVQADTTADFWVYDFKETYASLFEEYSKLEQMYLETMS